MIFSDVAVETQHLQVGWESFFFHSDVEAVSGIMRTSAMCIAIIIDVIQRQKSRASFSATDAFLSVMGQNIFFQILRPLA